MTTVNADGGFIASHITGPFGEKLANQTAPTNTQPGTTWGYVGQHQKLTESSLLTNLTQMGARVYIADLGRFLSVDPVEGGTPNAYAYPTDPVNDFDLDGRIAWLAVIALGVSIGMTAGTVYEAYKNPTPFNVALAGVAVATTAFGGGLAAYSAKSTVKAIAPNMTKKMTQMSGKIIPKLKAGIGKVGQRVGQKMYDSKIFGRQSALFGSKQLGSKQSGKLNNNNFLRIGWSTHNGQKTFRVAIGKNGTKSHHEKIIFRGRFR